MSMLCPAHQSAAAAAPFPLCPTLPAIQQHGGHRNEQGRCAPGRPGGAPCSRVFVQQPDQRDGPGALNAPPRGIAAGGWRRSAGQSAQMVLNLRPSKHAGGQQPAHPGPLHGQQGRRPMPRRADRPATGGRCRTRRLPPTRSCLPSPAPLPAVQGQGHVPGRLRSPGDRAGRGRDAWPDGVPHRVSAAGASKRAGGPRHSNCRGAGGLQWAGTVQFGILELQGGRKGRVSAASNGCGAPCIAQRAPVPPPPSGGCAPNRLGWNAARHCLRLTLCLFQPLHPPGSAPSSPSRAPRSPAPCT